MNEDNKTGCLICSAEIVYTLESVEKNVLTALITLTRHRFAATVILSAIIAIVLLRSI